MEKGIKIIVIIIVITLLFLLFFNYKRWLRKKGYLNKNKAVKQEIIKNEKNNNVSSSQFNKEDIELSKLEETIIVLNPIFMPSVGDFIQGMIVTIPIHFSNFLKKVDTKIIQTLMEEFYFDSKFVSVLKKCLNYGS